MCECLDNDLNCFIYNPWLLPPKLKAAKELKYWIKEVFITFNLVIIIAVVEVFFWLETGTGICQNNIICVCMYVTKASSHHIGKSNNFLNNCA